MRFDHSAGLKAWPVEFKIDGVTWRIPALPAADWLDAFLEGPDDLTGIVPGLVEARTHEDGTPDTLTTRLLWAMVDDDDPFAPGLEDERLEAARTALSVAAGVPWWIAGRLAAEAVTWTGVGGELVLRGVDYTRAPLAAVLAGAYRVIISSVESKQLPMVMAKIEAPPPGLAAVEAFDETEASNAFLSAMQRPSG